MKTSSLIQAISDALVALGMVEAESPDLTSSTTAGTGLTATRFWISCQSSDSEKVRQKQFIRMSHDVTITFVHQPKIRQQFDSMKGVMDLEDTIIKKLMTQSVTGLTGVRTMYKSTGREELVSGNLIRVTMEFNMEAEYDFVAGT